MESLFWVSLLVIVVAVFCIKLVSGAVKAILTLGTVAAVLFIIYVVVYGTTDSFVYRIDGEFSRMAYQGSPEFRAVVGWMSETIESVTNFFKELFG